MSEPYGQQPGDANQGFGAMPPAPAEHSTGPVSRPGTTTAAAVLAFVQAGVTLIATVLLMTLLGAVTREANESLGGVEVDEGGLTVAWLLAVGGLVGAALLIWAGVKALSGTAGNLMLIALGLQVVLCVVWLLMGAPIAIAFAIMPIVALVLFLGAPAKQYEASRRGA